MSVVIAQLAKPDEEAVPRLEHGKIDGREEIGRAFIGPGGRGIAQLGLDPFEVDSLLQGDLPGPLEAILEPAHGMVAGRDILQPQRPFQTLLGVSTKGIKIDERFQGGGFGSTQGIINAVEVIVGPEDEDDDENQ